MSSRPRSKKSNFGDEDYDFHDSTLDPTMRYVDIHSRTPWTTSDKNWRAVSAPLLWPQELRDASSPPSRARSQFGGESEDEDPFAEERTTLSDMKKSMNKINKFYIPISKLPPLGSVNPSFFRGMGDRPPSCAPERGVPRAHKIIQRWQSMPRLRSQLPAESLQVIEAAIKRDKQASARWLDHHKQRLEKTPLQHSNRGSSRGSARREDTDARLINAYWEAEEGSARGKKEYPHIACDCCDHKVEKSWKSPRPENPPGSARKSPGRKSPGRKSPQPPGHKGHNQYAQGQHTEFPRGASPGATSSARGRPHCVSFQDAQDAASEGGHSSGSEHWHG